MAFNCTNLHVQYGSVVDRPSIMHMLTVETVPGQYPGKGASFIYLNN